MQYRQLGQYGPKVSALGLGCMGLSPFYGDTDPNEAKKTVIKAYDEGINFFDVADIYGFGLSERILGSIIKPHRDQVIIASKAGIVIDHTGEAPKLCGTNTTPNYIKAACDKSLLRLGMDYLDLSYIHRVDTRTPLEETIEAMKTLIDEGKIKHIGLSQVSAEQIRRAHAIHPIAAVQSEYSLLHRYPESDGVLAACRELGIAFVAYSPLSRGLLTGTIEDRGSLEGQDFRRNLPRFSEDNIQQNVKLVRRFQEIAAKINHTPAQLALAWLLHQGEDIIPIPGASECQWLLENNRAIDLVLDDAILQEINALFPENAVSGAQFPEAAHNMFTTFVDNQEILNYAQ